MALDNLQWLICHETQPNPIYLIYMYVQDLASNNWQGLISHEILPTNQPTGVVASVVVQFMGRINVFKNHS